MSSSTFDEKYTEFSLNRKHSKYFTRKINRIKINKINLSPDQRICLRVLKRFFCFAFHRNIYLLSSDPVNVKKYNSVIIKCKSIAYS